MEAVTQWCMAVATNYIVLYGDGVVVGSSRKKDWQTITALISRQPVVSGV